MLSDNSQDLLQKFAKPFTGLQIGDNPKHLFKFWESNDYSIWDFIQSPTEKTKFYGGCDEIVHYQNGTGRVCDEQGSVLRNVDCRKKKGIIVHRMGDLPVTIYTGELIDQNAAVIIPYQPEMLIPIWVFLESSEFSQSVRRIDKKLGVTPATLVKVPFHREYGKRKQKRSTLMACQNHIVMIPPNGCFTVILSKLKIPSGSYRPPIRL